MKKKIIGIFVIALIMTSFLVGIVAAKDSLIPAKEIDIKSKMPEECFELLNDENKTEISTVGPISPLLFVTEISLIDGPFLKVKFIEEILGNRIFHFIFPNISINVKDLTFMIKYTKNIPQLPILKKFFYSTTIKENGNETFFNTKHTIIVTGFEGEFGLYRTKLIKLYTAHFWFDGICEEAIVIT
ncbi:MAG: hypothetical protein JSW06_00775 [Thermoplasmatales archaeon]|nr:MAG: hypothetical protein JSW06_00775 [Thermoplasmatales archaeon]